MRLKYIIYDRRPLKYKKYCFRSNHSFKLQIYAYLILAKSKITFKKPSLLNISSTVTSLIKMIRLGYCKCANDHPSTDSNMTKGALTSAEQRPVFAIYDVISPLNILVNAGQLFGFAAISIANMSPFAFSIWKAYTYDFCKILQ